MAKEGTVLIVDDNRSILEALRLLLGNHFARVLTLPSPNRLDETLRKEEIDVILLDMNFRAGINTGNEGLYWLHEIRQRRPDAQIVVFTAYANTALAVQAMREGAADFVEKPWNNQRLVSTLLSAYSLSRSERKVKQLKSLSRENAAGQPMFWGTSHAMTRVREIVEKVAATDAHVLVTGENGTGKEMLAREIHDRSRRSGELMVCVDLGAVPATLFESELFGHVRGAFTDAKSDRAGKFEAADKGTLFLDEIGNLPVPLQAKLLSAIQSGRIVRVGSNTPVDVDIRLVSATNRNLYDMVSAGAFREDLLYRINTIHIELPPLRERREDILPLAQLFLERYAAKYHKIIDGFDAGAERAMLQYPWAGNIRELQHTVEKAVILCDGTSVTASALLLRPAETPVTAASFSTLEQMERQMIAQAMVRHGGNLSAVAQQLGITRQTLYNKIKRFGL